MKANYMKQVYNGTIGDMKNLEQHYAEMAQKGWMIEEIGVFTHTYRAVEPCKKRFFVDFLPQITAFDYPENEDAQDYRSICEEYGWNFIAANKQFHVFCADDENNNPIPIHTDNKIHANIYLKASRKYELPWLIYVLFMFGFSSQIGSGAELFLSNIRLFMMMGYAFFMVGYLWTLGFAISWYIRTKKSAKSNLPLPIVNRRLAKVRNNVFMAGAIALIVCMIIGVALEVMDGMPITFILVMFMPLSALGVGLWIRKQIDTKRRTRAGNIGLTIGVIVIMEIVLLGTTAFIIMNTSFASYSNSIEEYPLLTLKDVGVTTEPLDTSAFIKGSVAVPTDYEYWESGREGNVQTRLYVSVSEILTNWLYDHFTKKLIKNHSDKDSVLQGTIITLTYDEAEYWGAEKGMALYYTNSNSVRLLLQKDKAIISINATGENMNLDTLSQAVQRLWVQ